MSDTQSAAGDGLPEYAGLLAARHAAHRPELEAVVREYWGGRTLDVLDLACGDGFWSESFDRTLGPGASITAVDLSGAFLTWTNARIADDGAAVDGGPAHRVRCVAADAVAMPFPDAAFDVAWCAQSLISLPNPPAALAELRRVVRPGGTVAVLENDRLHEMQLPLPVPLELALRRAERTIGRDSGKTDADEPYVGRFVERLMLEAGLTPTRRITRPIDRRPPLTKADRAFLEAYFHNLIERTARALPPARHDEVRRLADPGSPDYLPGRPDFWMTWTDVLVLAERTAVDPIPSAR